MGFLGYNNDRDPDTGPLATTKLYRFVAGFATILIVALLSGCWRPWQGSLYDWWMLVTATVVGIGTVREGMGFINYALFWRYPDAWDDINLWYLALLIFTAGVLVYLYLSSH